jgi:hypothetical protein
MENEILGEAVREYLTESRKGMLRRILEDEAFLLLKAGRADALRCIAAANALESEPEALALMYDFMRRTLEGPEQEPGEKPPGGGRIILP